MKMPKMSLLDWQKNMEQRRHVQKHCFVLDGQKGFIVHVADVKNPAT